MFTKLRKRSEYRRPSQMGVPNSKFKGDSDYKLNYLRNEIERKSSNSKPSDQLVPEGNIETSTEKKESFTVIIQFSFVHWDTKGGKGPRKT